jgi:hypothetical protein
MRDPPVSRRFPRRARSSACCLRVAATRPRRALKAPANRASRPRRCPDSRPPPRLARRRPLLFAAASRCPLPTVRVQACHATDADRPLPPPPRRSSPSRTCPSVVHASSSTPPSTSFGRRRHRPVSRCAVAFATPPCHLHAAVYIASSAAPLSTRR